MPSPPEGRQFVPKWFVAIGWFYLPCSLAGGIATLISLAFVVTVFRAVDHHSHSASDTIYGVFPYFVCTFLLLDWLARRTSGTLADSEEQ